MASTHFLWRPPPSLLGLHPCSSLCQLIGGTPKFHDISDFILGSLYWLPIQQRMQLKTLSHMRNCFVGVVQSYTRDLSAPWSSLHSQGLPCNLPLTVLSLFRVCALCYPIPELYISLSLS